MTPVSQRTVAILAFDDMEVLDFAGPYEVFNVAGELGDGHPFTVFSVGLSSAPAVGRGGFTVQPTYSLDVAPPPDHMKAFLDGYEYRQSFEFHPAWLEYSAAYSKALDPVFAGDMAVADALNSAAATANGILKRYADFKP